MTLLLKLEANFTGTVLTVVDGATVTGYAWKAGGEGLGAPVFSPMYSRTVDSLGTRVTGFSLGSKERQIPIEIVGTGSSDAARHQSALSYYAALESICDEMRRYGGKVHYRGANATYVTTFPCPSAQVGALHSDELEAFGRSTVPLAMVQDAYGEAAPLDASDAFSTDTLGVGGKYNLGGADWTAYAGAVTNGVVQGGAVRGSANLSTLNLWAHTGTGRTYQNTQVTLKHTTGSSVTAYTAGVSPCILGSDALNYIEVYVAKATDTLRVDKIVDGTRTNLANTAITALAANTTYWIRARIENNTIHAEHWTAEPTPIGTTGRTATTPYDLTQTEARMFGREVPGRVGLSWTPITAAASIDDFSIQPNTVRNWTMPDVVPVNATVGGSVAAPTDVIFSTTGGTAPVSMVGAWWPRPPVSNLCWNGNGEAVGTSATVAYGWVATAVAGVIGAADTVVRTTTAASVRTGAASIQIDTPATTDTGASFLVYQRFKKGVTYALLCWVRSAAATTAVRCKLGVSGDVATSATLALSTTWTPRLVLWTPTADREGAYIAVGVSAATDTTFQVDDLMVWEVRGQKDAYSSSTDLSPVAYWRLGESSGSVTDAIGGLVGSVNGNPTYGRRGPIPGDDTTCMDFDGTGDSISVAYSATLNPALFSVESWVMRDTDTGAAENIVYSTTASALLGYNLRVTSADVASLLLGDGVGLSAAVTGTTTLTTGVWYHVVATYDGTNARLYVNGSLEAVGADAYTPNDSGTFEIGRSNAGASLFNGKIANVRVYNRVLTGEEIARRAVGPLPALTAGGFGPGILNAANYDSAAASVGSAGAAWTQTASATYRSGYAPRNTTTITAGQGNLEYFIDPRLFTPDDYVLDEVDVAVFGRFEVGSAKVSVNAVLSVKPEGGSSFGAVRYSEFAAAGRTLKLPSSDQFRPYYLGTVTFRVDRANPLRWKLVLTITDGAGSDTLGVDYLVLVPSFGFCSSQTGVAQDSTFPSFVASTSETTKRIRSDLSLLAHQEGSAVSKAGYPDGSLLKNRIMLDKGASDVLIWPSDLVIDRTDAATTAMALSHACTVSVIPRPQYSLSRDT